ncbi:hypothetical protein ACLKA6_011429 [Drosophila palustris]
MVRDVPLCPMWQPGNQTVQVQLQFQPQPQHKDSKRISADASPFALLLCKIRLSAVVNRQLGEERGMQLEKEKEQEEEPKVKVKQEQEQELEKPCHMWIWMQSNQSACHI